MKGNDEGGGLQMRKEERVEAGQDTQKNLPASDQKNINMFISVMIQIYIYHIYNFNRSVLEDFCFVLQRFFLGHLFTCEQEREKQKGEKKDKVAFHRICPLGGLLCHPG